MFLHLTTWQSEELCGVEILQQACQRQICELHTWTASWGPKHPHAMQQGRWGSCTNHAFLEPTGNVFLAKGLGLFNSNLSFWGMRYINVSFWPLFFISKTWSHHNLFDGPIGLLLQIQNRWGFGFRLLGAPPFRQDYQCSAIESNASHCGFIDQLWLHPLHQLHIILTEPCSDGPVPLPQLAQRKGTIISSITRNARCSRHLCRLFNWWALKRKKRLRASHPQQADKPIWHPIDHIYSLDKFWSSEVPIFVMRYASIFLSQVMIISNTSKRFLKARRDYLRDPRIEAEQDFWAPIALWLQYEIVWVEVNMTSFF